MEGVSGDLQAKYQKVASEYSKLRAQVGVLKKAVLDEQTKNTEMKEVLKKREQSLRKAEQEMDSLIFRNQQLTKRVTVLQDELDTQQVKSKKGKVKGNELQKNAETSNQVIDEEFQQKIAENERLVSALEDQQTLHEREIVELNEKIQRLEHELQQHQVVNSDAEEKYKAVIQSLETENSSLDRGFESRGKELQAANEELEKLKLQHHNLDGRLERAQCIISHHLPFVDSGRRELNELNIPYHDRKQNVYSLHVISQAGNYLRELTGALSDYHTYTEQRLQAVDPDRQPITIRLLSYLRDNARYLRALEQGFDSFQNGVETETFVSLETLHSLECLAVPLASYTDYLQKLLPYHQLSLQEENSRASTSESVRSWNQEILKHTSSITNDFLKLKTYVRLLASQTKRTCQHPPTSQRRFLLEVTEVLKSLQECMKDLARCTSSKAEIENETPTISIKVRATNDCLVKSLGMMVSSITKLSGLLSDSRAELWKGMGSGSTSSLFINSKTHPTVASFKKRAVTYMNSLEQDEQPSVPYEEALQERERALSNILSSESLNEHLSNLRQKATKLEQDREHWKLEYQLLHLQHDKVVKDLEQQLQTVSSDRTSPQQGEEASSDAEQSSATVTNLLGHLTASVFLKKEAEAREAEVKCYLMERIYDLVATSQESETKATTLASECQALQRRLELALECRNRAESGFQEGQETVARLQEELHTTTHNYETQLSIMSEHLANMNDRLTMQRDEIDQLKYQMNQGKVGRKGKQK